MTDDDNREPAASPRFGIDWPPSPKMQIVLIALGFGLLNLLLVIIWAVALYITR